MTQLSNGNHDLRAELAREATQLLLEGMRANRALYAELEAAELALRDALMQCLEAGSAEGYVEGMVEVGRETNGLVEVARSLANRLNTWAADIALMSNKD